MDVNLIQTFISLSKDTISAKLINKQPKLRIGFISLTLASAIVATSTSAAPKLTYEQNEAMIKTLIPVWEALGLDDTFRSRYENFSNKPSNGITPTYDIATLIQLQSKLIDAYKSYEKSLTGDQKWAVNRLINALDLRMESGAQVTPDKVKKNMTILTTRVTDFCHAFNGDENGIELFCGSTKAYYADGGYVDKQYRQRYISPIYKVQKH